MSTSSFEPTPPPSWKCTICLDQYNDYSAFQITRNGKMCKDCVAGLFERALAHEINYPAKYDVVILHPKHFSLIISDDFVRRYEEKEKEYRTPPNKRVYCAHRIQVAQAPRSVESSFQCVDGIYEEVEIQPKTSKHRLQVAQTPQSVEGIFEEVGTQPETLASCGAFINRLRTSEESEGTFTASTCKTCKGVSCLMCGHPLPSISKLGNHHCAENIESAKLAKEKEEKAAFKDLKRGRHWQCCPNPSCERHIELSEACNHIECVCGTGFCFVCGERAGGGSDHWRRGGCPRYNFPGDANAEFDGEGGGGGGWNDNRGDAWDDEPVMGNDEDDGRMPGLVPMTPGGWGLPIQHPPGLRVVHRQGLPPQGPNHEIVIVENDDAATLPPPSPTPSQHGAAVPVPDHDLEALPPPAFPTLQEGRTLGEAPGVTGPAAGPPTPAELMERRARFLLSLPRNHQAMIDGRGL